MIPEYWLIKSGVMLAVMATIGLVAVLLRWPAARRKDYLFAFAVILVGLVLREVAVAVWGGRSWPDEAILLSTVGRVLKLIGAVLFVRAATLERCGEVFWVGTLGLSVALAVVL